jgi:hypothetical protein
MQDGAYGCKRRNGKGNSSMKSKTVNTHVKPHYYIKDGYVCRAWRGQVKFLHKVG